MKYLLKDSGLNGMKATVQFCADCQKSTVHFRTPAGVPICGVCGYNAELVALCARLDGEAGEGRRQRDSNIFRLQRGTQRFASRAAH